MKYSLAFHAEGKNRLKAKGGINQNPTNLTEKCLCGPLLFLKIWIDRLFYALAQAVDQFFRNVGCLENLTTKVLNCLERSWFRGGSSIQKCAVEDFFQQTVVPK